MADLITHVPSILALRTEAATIAADSEHPMNEYFVVNEDQTVDFSVVKIPVHYTSNDETLCLIRGIDRSVIESSTSINVIGEHLKDAYITNNEGEAVYIENDYIFDEGGEAIYNSIYNQAPRMIDDGDGGQVQYTPPSMIGVFA